MCRPRGKRVKSPQPTTAARKFAKAAAEKVTHHAAPITKKGDTVATKKTAPRKAADSKRKNVKQQVSDHSDDEVVVRTNTAAAANRGKKGKVTGKGGNDVDKLGRKLEHVEKSVKGHTERLDSIAAQGPFVTVAGFMKVQREVRRLARAIDDEGKKSTAASKTAAKTAKPTKAARVANKPKTAKVANKPNAKKVRETAKQLLLYQTQSSGEEEDDEQDLMSAPDSDNNGNVEDTSLLSGPPDDSILGGRMALKREQRLLREERAKKATSHESLKGSRKRQSAREFSAEASAGERPAKKQRSHTGITPKTKHRLQHDVEDQDGRSGSEESESEDEL